MDTLYQCIEKNNLEEMNTLLYDMKENISTSETNALLSFSLEKERFACAEILLANGADVQGIDKHGYTQLMRCCTKEENKSSTIRFLVQHGALVNYSSYTHHTPLVYAIQNNNVINTIALIENGADVNHVDGVKMTPLLHCAFSGNFDIMNILIDMGATTVCQDAFGSTPLLICLRLYPSKKACYLSKLTKEHNVINIANDMGYTPLIQSILNNDVNLCQMLLDMGVHIKKDFSMIDREIARALDFSTCTSERHTLNMLYFGAGNALLPHYFMEKTHPIVQEILDDYDKVDLKSKCRKCIRRVLFKQNINLFHRVNMLPLPTLLKSYLLYQ